VNSDKKTEIRSSSHSKQKKESDDRMQLERSDDKKRSRERDQSKDKEEPKRPKTTPKKFSSSLKVLPCKQFHLYGRCKGERCLYSHEPLNGTVKLWGEDADQTTVQSFVSNFQEKKLPCKYFHLNSMCYNGSSCKYSHEKLSSEELQWLRHR